VKGKLNGFKVTGFDEATLNEDGRPVVQGKVEDVEVEGDLVEVLVTVPAKDEFEGKERARDLCYSTLGLLALSFGQQIVGDQVFEDYFFSGPEEEEGEISIPFNAPFSAVAKVAGSMAAETDIALANLSSTDLLPSVSLALRWYYKGLTSSFPTDAFISHFIGIETIANGHFAGIIPPPKREEYSALSEYFSKASPRIDNKLRDVVLERVADFPLAAKFQRYWKARFGNIGKSETSRFRSLNVLRNDVLHGRVTLVEHRYMSQARELLERMLARELSVGEATLRTHSEPRIHSAVLRYVAQAKES